MFDVAARTPLVGGGIDPWNLAIAAPLTNALPHLRRL